MGLFTYEALDRSGKSVTGEIEATTKDEAIKKIRSLGNFPRKINSKSDPNDKSKAAAGTSAAMAAKKKKRRASGGVGYYKRFKQLR